MSVSLPPLEFPVGPSQKALLTSALSSSSSSDDNPDKKYNSPFHGFLYPPPPSLPSSPFPTIPSPISPPPPSLCLIIIHRIVFTVVSDPVEQEGDCGEVGTAEVDLTSVRSSSLLNYNTP